MPKRKLSVTEFKTHCTEALREVETKGETLSITRHGKVVALVVPARGLEGPKSLAEWLGCGKGTVTFAADYDPSEPASAPEGWEALRPDPKARKESGVAAAATPALSIKGTEPEY